MPKIKKNIIPTVQPAPEQPVISNEILEDTEGIQPESEKQLVNSKEVFTGSKSKTIAPEASIEEPDKINEAPASKTGKNGRSKKPQTETQKQHLDFMREKATQAREVKRLEREQAKTKREEAKALKKKLQEEKKALEEKRKQEEELEYLKEQQEIEMLQNEISALKPKSLEQVKQVEEYTNKAVEQKQKSNISFGEAGNPRSEPEFKEQNGTFDLEQLIIKGIQGYDTLRQQREEENRRRNEITQKERKETEMIRRQLSKASNKPYDPYANCFNFS